MSGGHGHIEGSNKRIALLIAVLALFLAFAETLAKGSQTTALGANVEASNLWAFFQAKTVRMTVARTAGEQMAVLQGQIAEPVVREAAARQIDAWSKNAARWDSEPETGEGRKELSARAAQAEKTRDTALAKYHHFELASAAFQIAIVLASSMVITGLALLAWAAGALGLAGLGFMAIGVFAPHTHLF
jgi:hypothetical protein